MDLVKVTREIRANGPKRVVINASGEATIPLRASREHGIVSVVVFLRNDGWTLGAPEHLRGCAQVMWADSWIAVMENFPEGVFKALTR